MQFLRIAAVLSLVAAVGTEVRAEWFSINNAISQAVLTNPGVGEASANRRATEAELRQTQGTEVNAIVPTVVVGAAGFEPAGSLPRAPSPASSTSVPALATHRGESDGAHSSSRCRRIGAGRLASARAQSRLEHLCIRAARTGNADAARR